MKSGSGCSGVRTKGPMFVFRLSRSGQAIHRICPPKPRKAFLEDHVEAFDVLGGFPTKHIRYDSLTSAVTAVVFGQGRQRRETTGGCCSARTTASMPSIASMASQGRTKRRG